MLPLLYINNKNWREGVLMSSRPKTTKHTRTTLNGWVKGYLRGQDINVRIISVCGVNLLTHDFSRPIVRQPDWSIYNFVDTISVMCVWHACYNECVIANRLLWSCFVDQTSFNWAAQQWYVHTDLLWMCSLICSQWINSSNLFNTPYMYIHHALK